MQVFNDQVNQLRLCKLYGAIAELLNLDAQEVPDVSLIINGESVRACMQVRDDGVYRMDVGIEDDAVVVIETRIESARLEANFLHALVHVFVPYTTCLLLSIYVVHQLECMCLP